MSFLYGIIGMWLDIGQFRFSPVDSLRDQAVKSKLFTPSRFEELNSCGESISSSYSFCVLVH